jgi:hypothetical protein
MTEKSSDNQKQEPKNAEAPKTNAETLKRKLKARRMKKVAKK